MGKLTDKLREVYVGALGNRATVAGRACLVAGMGAHFYSELLPSSSVSAGLLRSSSLCLGWAWFALEGLTLGGMSTLKNYKAMRDKIRKTGRLDEEPIEAILGDEKNNCIYGYCQLQGAYFAARGEGRLKEFREIKKKVSRNTILNF